VNALRRTIEAFVDTKPSRPIFPRLWDHLIQLKEERHAVVQDVVGPAVYWRDAQGKERKTTRKRVENILAEIHRSRRPRRP
jgi:hypothetical protein